MRVSSRKQVWTTLKLSDRKDRCSLCHVFHSFACMVKIRFHQLIPCAAPEVCLEIWIAKNWGWWCSVARKWVVWRGSEEEGDFRVSQVRLGTWISIRLWTAFILTKLAFYAKGKEIQYHFYVWYDTHLVLGTNFWKGDWEDQWQWDYIAELEYPFKRWWLLNSLI